MCCKRLACFSSHSHVHMYTCTKCTHVILLHEHTHIHTRELVMPAFTQLCNTPTILALTLPESYLKCIKKMPKTSSAPHTYTHIHKYIHENAQGCNLVLLLLHRQPARQMLNLNSKWILLQRLLAFSAPSLAEKRQQHTYIYNNNMHALTTTNRTLTLMQR